MKQKQRQSKFVEWTLTILDIIGMIAILIGLLGGFIAATLPEYQGQVRVYGWIETVGALLLLVSAVATQVQSRLFITILFVALATGILTGGLTNDWNILACIIGNVICVGLLTLIYLKENSHS